MRDREKNSLQMQCFFPVNDIDLPRKSMAIDVTQNTLKRCVEKGGLYASKG
jgi:hypothetical protein